MQQHSLGLEIFAEVRHSRQALAELNVVKNNLGTMKNELKGQTRVAGPG